MPINSCRARVPLRRDRSRKPFRLCFGSGVGISVYPAFLSHTPLAIKWGQHLQTGFMNDSGWKAPGSTAPAGTVGLLDQAGRPGRKGRSELTGAEPERGL